MREGNERSAKKEIDRLELSLRAAETERFGDATELEQLTKDCHSLRRVVTSLTRPPESPTDVAPDLDPNELEVPTGIAEAVDLARRALPLVEVPKTALEHIDELASAEKYAVWASAIWQGLMALNAYAKCKLDGEQPPGFNLWCKNTGAWSTARLAMKESDTVVQNPVLRGQRLFGVSKEVDPSGRVIMYSHLKIQVGGGDSIPRLYFFDDTDGPTRKMHVGYLGPHRFVQNTKS